jgi:hypothetical protein
MSQESGLASLSEAALDIVRTFMKKQKMEMKCDFESPLPFSEQEARLAFADWRGHNAGAPPGSVSTCRLRTFLFLKGRLSRLCRQWGRRKPH